MRKLGDFHVFLSPAHEDKTCTGQYARGIYQKGYARNTFHARMMGTFTEAAGGSVVTKLRGGWGATLAVGCKTCSSFLGEYHFLPVFSGSLVHFLVANVRNEKHLNGTCRKTSRILRHTFKFLKAKPFGSLKRYFFNRAFLPSLHPHISVRNSYNKAPFSETIK